MRISKGYMARQHYTSRQCVCVCAYVTKIRSVSFSSEPKYRLTLIIDAFVLYQLFIYITKNQMEEENGKAFCSIAIFIWGKKRITKLGIGAKPFQLTIQDRCSWTSKSLTFSYLFPEKSWKYSMVFQQL